MNEPQGILRYGGVAADGAFSVSRSVGATPGHISAQFILGANLPFYGDVDISYGTWSRTLRGCRLRRDLIAASGGGGRWQDVIIEDRRWRWQFDGQFGQLYGFYNHWERGIRIDGALATSTLGPQVGATQAIRSLRQLAEIVLEFMGESGFDVSRLPNDFYPPIEWDGVLAAEALESLADMVGCMVVLGWDDRVRIVERGVGASYPTDSRVMDITESWEPKVVPEKVIIEAGITRFQRDLPLEAVGIDSTGEIRPIDELLYKPSEGWEGEDPGQFYGVDEKFRNLAQSCVWKMYRVKPPFAINVSPVLALRGVGAMVQANELWRVLPLESTQLEIYRDPDAIELKPAEVIGFFCDNKFGWKNNAALNLFGGAVPSTPINPDYFAHDNITNDFPDLIFRGYQDKRGPIYDMAFSIDESQGIVHFNEPFFLITLDGNGNATGVEAARVVLRTAFVLRSATTRAPLRQQYVVNTGGVLGVTKTLRKNDLLFEIANPIAEHGYIQVGPPNFVQECQFYARQYLTQFYNGPSATIPGKGFMLDIDVDGAIRSVTLRRSGNGECTTEIEWNTERAENRLTWSEQFGMKTINRAVADFKAGQAAAMRQRGKRTTGFRGGGSNGGFGV